MRALWSTTVPAVLVAAVGAAGLVRAAVPIDAAGDHAAVVVSDAYVRPPVPPNTSAAAYFTVTNSGGTPDRLLSVTSAAGTMTMLHSTAMRPEPGGAAIPARGRLVLSTGRAHVMIEGVRTTMRPGRRVRLVLRFQHAGTIDVAARVIPIDAPNPEEVSR